MNTKLARVFRTALTVLFLYALPSVVFSQTFDIDDPASGGTSDPADTLIVGQSTVTAKISSITGFATGDKLYFYYVDPTAPFGQNSASDLYVVQNNLIGTNPYSIPASVPASRNFSGVINQVGDYELYIAHWSGRQDYQTLLNDANVAQTFGTGNTGFPYQMNGNGNRSLRTNIISLAGETAGNVWLEVNLTGVNNDENHGVQVEYSTNGTTWTVLTDTNGINYYCDTNVTFGTAPIVFELPAGAINANTRFRVTQLNAVGLYGWQENFTIFSMNIFKGAPFAFEFAERVYTSDPTAVYVVRNAPVPPAAATADIVITDIQDLDANSIGSAEAGDTIVVLADANLDYAFTPSASRFRLVNTDYVSGQGTYGLDFRILSTGGVTIANDLVVNPTKQIITIKAIVPHNVEIFDYNWWINHNMEIMYLESGTTIDWGAGAANFSDFSGYDFDNAGAREYVISGLNILDEDGAELNFYLERTTNPIPPAGTEIVVEYTTDGVTYTTLDEISLTDAGTSGAWYTIDTMPAGIVSAATDFRIRQKDSTLMEGVHTWYLDDITFSSSGTNPNYVLSDNTWSFGIIRPGYDVNLVNENIGPLYSGTTVSLEFSNVHGKFPDNTVFEVYGDIDNNQTYLIDDLASAPTEGGTFTVKTPFADGMHEIFVRAESRLSYSYGPIAESSDNFYLQPVYLNLGTITYDAPIMDGGSEYTGPGKTIDVTYSITGTIDPALTVNAELQVQDDNTGSWLTIASEVAGATGAFNDAELPMTEMSGNIRVILTSPGLGQYFDQNLERWGAGSPVGSFPLDGPSRFGYNVYIDAQVAQTVAIEYSTDGGSTWTQLATKNAAAGFKGFIFHYGRDLYSLPVTSGNIWFRASAAATGNNMDYTGYRLESENVVPTTAVATGTIDLVYPTITFNDIYEENASALLNGSFEYGKTYNIKYSTTGEWPDSTNYAFAFNHNGKYLVLATSDVQGTNTVSFTIPSKDSLENYFGTSSSLDLYVYAYSQDPYADLRLDMGALYLDDISFYGVNQGGDLYSDGYFEAYYGQDSRYLQTKPMDLSTLAGPVNFRFDWYSWVDNPTLPTLVRFQVSTDGGITFTDLAIPGSDVPNRLDNYTNQNNFVVPIDNQYLTNNVIFRWYQEIGNGEWSVEDQRILRSDNELDLYSRYFAYQEVDMTDGMFDCSVYDDALEDYEIAFLDSNNQNYPANIDPSVYTGQDLTFSYNEVSTSEPDMPAGTEYSFVLRYDNGNVVTYPATGDAVVFGPYTTVNDTFTVTMPTFLATGVYDFEVVAEYVYDTTQAACGKSYLDWGANLFVINDENVVTRSLTLVDPTNAQNRTYEVEEVFNVTYDAFGNWPSTVKFATVLWWHTGNGWQYEFIGEGTTTGAGQVIPNLNMISSPKVDINGNLIDDYALEVVAYEGTTPVLGDIEYYMTSSDLAISAAAEFNGNYRVDLYGAGNREVMSAAFDLTGLPDASLAFDYYADDITVSTNTLPQLLITTDGVNFDTLEVDGNFGDRGFLGNNGWYSYNVEIPASYLNSVVAFKWIQQVNGGQNQDGWQLEDIRILSGTANYYGSYISDYAWINLSWANLGNYNWAVAEVNGLEPTIFNGGSFDYTWNIGVDMAGDTLKKFPAGTEFEFILTDGGDVVTDPATGDTISLGTTTANVGQYTATLPFLLNAGWYDVTAIATHNGVVLEEDEVGAIQVFNDVVRTTHVSSNNVLYAGETVTIAANLENTLNISNYTNVYFNLIAYYGGEEWLLAAQQGLGSNFTVALPSFMNGNNIEFYVAASVNAPMGVVGEPLSSYSVTYLGGGDFNGNYPFVTGSIGQMGQTYTDELDLTNADKLEFKIKSSEVLANLQADQVAELSYSTDGGVTYTTLASYPDARFTNPSFFDNEDLEDYFNESISIPAGAKTENTILRWRVEESNGTIEIANVEITPVSVSFLSAPVGSISTYIDILEQRIDVTSTDALEYCSDDVVTLNYNVRGVFGSATTYTVQHFDPYNYGWYNVESNGNAVTFAGVATGAGSYQLDLSTLDPIYTYNPAMGYWDDWNINGNNNQFRLVAEDNTTEDWEFDVTSSVNANAVSVVAEITEGYAFAQNAWSWGTNVSCSSDARQVVITSVQPNFVYSLRNYVTGAAIGTAVVADPNDTALTNPNNMPYYNVGAGQLSLPVGLVTGRTQVEAIVKSQNESGSFACDSIAISHIAEFDVRPAYALYFRENSNAVWTAVAAGQNFSICEGSDDLEFAVGYYYNGSFNGVSADWYRNNNMSEVAGSTWMFGDFAVTGNYYVMVEDESCGNFTSAPVTVTVNPAPAQPAITAAGATTVCEGGTVTLNATAGFAYYEWIDDNGVVGTNSSSFTATESGNYYVRVSNAPFGTGCESPYANPVAVTVNEFSSTWFGSSSIELCGSGPKTAEVTVYGMQNGVTYQMVNVATGANFGSSFSSTSGSATITTPAVALSSQYELRATFDNNTTCQKTMSSVLTINIAKDVVAVVNNDGFTSSATAYAGCGNDFYLAVSEDNTGNTVDWVDNASVTWYKDGAVYSSSQTIYPTQSGAYYARVVRYTNDECEINTATINVTINAAPARPVLTASSNILEFCEGEGNLTLRATAGAAAYHWYRNGSHISNVSSTSDTLKVTMSGEYTVVAENTNGCQSVESASIEVTVHETPNMPSIYGLYDATVCEAGPAYVMVTNAENDVVYQLYDVVTGLNSGAARTGQPNLVLTSDVLSADAALAVRATRIGSNCTIESPAIEIRVNILTITASGNVLISSITDADHYQWYRNGEMVINGGNSSTLKVYDTEEYTLEVVIGNCRLTSVIGQRSVKAAVAAQAKPSVYPNPANEVLNVVLNNSYVGEVSVEILNVAGQVVYQVASDKTAAEFKQVINLEFLRSGVYQIRVSGADFNEVTRIIKN